MLRCSGCVQSKLHTPTGTSSKLHSLLIRGHARDCCCTQCSIQFGLLAVSRQAGRQAAAACELGVTACSWSSGVNRSNNAEVGRRLQGKAWMMPMSCVLPLLCTAPVPSCYCQGREESHTRYVPSLQSMQSTPKATLFFNTISAMT